MLASPLVLATFTLTEIGLDCHAISEARLAGAVDRVAERLGDLAELRQRTVSPFEPDLSPGRPPPPAREPPPGLTRAQARRLECELLEDRYRAWLDEPLESLSGRTPRQAAGAGPRNELELRLRGIENRAERARRDGTAWPDVTWLRHELGLVEERAA